MALIGEPNPTCSYCASNSISFDHDTNGVKYWKCLLCKRKWPEDVDSYTRKKWAGRTYLIYPADQPSGSLPAPGGGGPLAKASSIEEARIYKSQFPKPDDYHIWRGDKDHPDAMKVE